ncbi:synaptotagmin-like protein 3 [Myotis lucifugus]|uniref:synaptotagmin-like protein 3 n=1 Tax=Myotis lucifugus TaxID=59463 RepID=UPI000CCC26BC|nr:synaptotagmin-like protein 3 [Myotis lucifugus]
MAQEVSLDALQELEQEAVLRVLRRDRAVQSIEEERVRKLKAHLQHLRWKGGKSPGQGHQEKACAHCRRALGLLLNRGAVCQGCSHCMCSGCRVFLSRTRLWRCTVCYEGRNVRIKSEEWFFEERAKKFPTEGRRETAGAKLLQSYQRLSSKILQELGQFKGFNKSVENLFLSVTTHMKKLSKSQNDMTSDKQLLSTGPRPGARTERRSQSDTAINATTRKVSAPDILMPLSQESPKRSTNPVSKQGGLSAPPAPSAPFSGGSRRVSLCLIAWTRGVVAVSTWNWLAVQVRLVHPLPCVWDLMLIIKLKVNSEDRYVKTYLLPDRSAQGKRKTGVQRNTVDPTFQETLKYQVELAQLVTRRLQVSVWHVGMLTRRVFLGEVIVPLATWDFEDSTTQSLRWHPLRAK